MGRGARKKAARAEAAANVRAARADTILAARERVRVLRQGRVQSERAIAVAGNAGLATSSSVQGAVGALGSGLATQLQQVQSLDALNVQRLGFLSEAARQQARAASRSSIAGSIMQVGFAAAGLA